MITASLDTTQFDAALKEYMRESEHTLSEILNKQMYWICKRAWDLTPKASKERIMQLLGATSTVKIGPRSGKARTKYTYAPTSYAVNLVQFKRWKKGLPALTQAEAKSAAPKLISRAIGAVGTLQNGWKRAIGIFGQVIMQGLGMVQGGPRVKMPSTGKVAKPGWNSEAVASYNLLVKKGEAYILHPYILKAAQEALNAEAATTLEHARKKLQEVADRHNGR